MRNQHIIIAWIGTLVLGSLLVYPAGNTIDAFTGNERYGSLNDYWSMTVSYSLVAFFLSLPNLVLLLVLRKPLRRWLRFEQQFDVTLALTLLGIWLGSMVLDNEPEAALAYSAGGIITILMLRFKPVKRSSSLVL